MTDDEKADPPGGEALTALGASQLSELIRGRKVSCEQVMRAYLSRIHRLNPRFNAIVSLRSDDDCLAAASKADQDLEAGRYRGWMHGLPQAVKDLSHVKGMPTSFGSTLLAGEIAEQDDPHVARVREAGAIFIGKTNTPEWGLGSQTYNRVFGETRNALNPEWTAGGSSGGAACALALGLLPVADGSDMMGSLRNPAAFNEVIGFRPGRGRIPPAEELPPGELSLATAGPMGRHVTDTERLFCTQAGLPYDPLPKSDLAGFRIGWMGDYQGYLPTEAAVVPLCEQALRRLSERGATVEPTLPDFDLAALWQSWVALRHSALAADQELYADPDKRLHMKPEWRWEIEGSLVLNEEDVSNALRVAADWASELNRQLGQFDVLALPSAQVFPFPVETHWPREINGVTMDTYHRWMEVSIGASLAGFPVISLPAGRDERGRPMGVQFIAGQGKDLELLSFARSVEEAGCLS